MDRSKERDNIVPFLPIGLEIGREINLKQDLTEHWILPHVSSTLSLHIIKDNYIKANALGLWQILRGFMYTAYHLFFQNKQWSSSEVIF